MATDQADEYEEFEFGWSINASSFLRKVLEPGSVWTEKNTNGLSMIIINQLDKDNKEVICGVDGDPTVTLVYKISDLLTHFNPPSLEFEYRGEIEYGVNCEKCNRYFDHQKKTKGFRCWACKHGY